MAFTSSHVREPKSDAKTGKHHKDAPTKINRAGWFPSGYGPFETFLTYAENVR